MDEEKKEETAKEEPKTTDASPKNRVSTLPVIAEAREATEAQRLVNAETRKLQERQAEILAEERLSGRSMAGFIQQDKPLTDEEYAKKVEKGEANPLKEDGFI